METQDEKLTRWIKLLDELDVKAKEIAKRPKDELDLVETDALSFDFVSIAYSKLFERADRNCGILSKADYYQLCAMFFCLKKQQSRQLLKELAKRYGVTFNGFGVKFR